MLSKAFGDGEPYAEGYFYEYDHDLTDEERFQFDPNSTMPEYDPERAPKLDPEVWPDERRSKALRNFGRGYIEEAVVGVAASDRHSYHRAPGQRRPTRASHSSTARNFSRS